MYIWSEQIPIGISACMYGAKLRYNTKGWDMVSKIGRDRNMFIFHPMCPEVMSGMGVPRKSIRIKGASGIDVWQRRAEVLDSSGRKWTHELKEACHDVMELVHRQQIRAYIYMEGSPTCGVRRTTLKNKRLGKPPGVLGAKLEAAGLFLISASDIQSPIKWWDIKRRLLAFIYLREMQIDSMHALFEMWHHYKFICQELDNTWARQFGHQIAQMKQFDVDLVQRAVAHICQLLREPSTVPKIKQMLWKHYCYLKKKRCVDLPDVLEPTDLRGMHHLAKELLSLSLASYDQGVIYGQMPVMYRRGR